LVSHPLRSRSGGIVPESALLLLMLGVFADNHDAAFAFDDLAFLANGFHTRSYFHGGTPFASYGRKSFSKRASLFYLLALAAPGDAPAGQIVRRELHGDLVTRQNPNEIHSKLPRNRCEYLVTVLELYLEHSVREGIRNDTFYFNNVLF